MDEGANKGYWPPVDAGLDDSSNWILNDMLIGQLKAMQAKHVMVISVPCFSGTITRGLKMEQRTPDSNAFGDTVSVNDDVKLVAELIAVTYLRRASTTDP